MTRQRLKESSIKWEINLSLESFAQKILKKIETLAFLNKTKIVSAFIPNKVSSFLNQYFKKEIIFFEKKYKFKINIIPDSSLIIPEYKIHLLDRKKKIIKKKSVKPWEKSYGQKEKLDQINPSLGLLAKPNFCNPILPAK